MEDFGLFGNTKKYAPLADRVRPSNLSEFVGQQHIVKKGGVVEKAINNGTLGSCIFYGPPGTGKTTPTKVGQFSKNSMPFQVVLQMPRKLLPKPSEIWSCMANALICYSMNATGGTKHKATAFWRQLKTEILFLLVAQPKTLTQA